MEKRIREATEAEKLNYGEFIYFKRLLTEVYPSGFASIVSDTWDFWKVMTYYLPLLKETILARDGRVVIRPDSGNPEDIICGTGGAKYMDISRYFKGDPLENPGEFEDSLLDEVRADTPHGEWGVEEHTGYYMVNGKYYKATIHNISWNRYDKQYYYIDMWEKAKITVEEITDTHEEKGAYEILWDIFGGIVNEKGYKVLNPKVGMIYGDSITLERQKEIYRRLEAKGFAATNLVLGVGSYTYQYKSRDSLGFAMKATWCQVNGEGREIFKDPKTDNGMKKSLKGLIRIDKDLFGDYEAVDQVSPNEEEKGELKTVFKNGILTKDWSLSEIRENVDESIIKTTLKKEVENDKAA